MSIMMKVASWFIPNSKKLAGMAADKIAEAINSQTERESQIAKIATMADKFTEYQAFVTRILTDGKISADEKAEITAKLVPLMDYLKGLI